MTGPWAFYRCRRTGPGSFVDFEAAFARHYASLFRYLDRLLGDADAAADIAQETFARLLGHEMPEERLRAWLFTVGTNLARDLARARKRRRRLLEAEGVELRPNPPPRPDQELERARRIEAVRRALADLSPKDRELLLMREEGFRYAEIAEAIGVSRTSVGTLLARALRRFAKAYGDPTEEAGRPDPAGPTREDERA